MDPVTLVVGALAAGAIAGVGDAAKTAVGDLYQRLKRVVAARVAGRPDAERALAEHEADPDTWERPLTKALTHAGIATDPEVVATAQRLMELVDPDGARGGKYVVNVAGAQGVQVGDHNTQTNTFG